MSQKVKKLLLQHPVSLTPQLIFGIMAKATENYLYVWEVEMIIKPRVKNFICLTAHPEGCRESVYRQMQYVKSQPLLNSKQRTLVIGSSTGYGLSSRICAAWADCSPTIGVCYEKPASSNRTATSGWYNMAAFEELAHQDGLYARTINGDAYSEKVKAEAAALIKKDLGQIDLLIYSVAAPRRKMPDGTMYTSVLKTVGKPFTSISLDLEKNRLVDKTILPANQQEIEATVHVMGGEDWSDWVSVLKSENLLSDHFHTVAYSYIGPEMTYPIYKEGTIGQAKNHLYNTALQLSAMGIPAFVSVNKAIVTQSSAAIPIVPLYIAVLYKVMKEAGTHENTIEQMYRLWNQFSGNNNPVMDIPGRIRLDDLEMREDVQKKAIEYLGRISDSNLQEYADIEGFWKDFYRLFGFDYENINYDLDIAADKPIYGMIQCTD